MPQSKTALQAGCCGTLAIIYGSRHQGTIRELIRCLVTIDLNWIAREAFYVELRFDGSTSHMCTHSSTTIGLLVV